jgi:hypothetical protein
MSEAYYVSSSTIMTPQNMKQDYVHRVNVKFKQQLGRAAFRFYIIHQSFKRAICSLYKRKDNERAMKRLRLLNRSSVRMFYFRNTLSLSI